MWSDISVYLHSSTFACCKNNILHKNGMGVLKLSVSGRSPVRCASNKSGER